MASLNSALPTRDEVDVSLKWHLNDLFESDNIWEEEFSAIKALIPSLAQLSGNLKSSAVALHQGIVALLHADLRLERLYVYAHMRQDEDNAVSSCQAMSDRAAALAVEMNTATSFVTPEILEIDDQTLAAWQKDYPPLAEYALYLEEITRYRPHTLSQREESLLAMTGDMARTARSAFDMLQTVDLDYPTIEGENGQQVKLSAGRYLQLMESQDRSVRQRAFEGFYSEFVAHQNTLAALLSGSVKKDVFYAKARNFQSAREASLFSDRVPVSVYDSLIEAIEHNLPTLHRYVNLKKRLLGVEQMEMYDIYAPLVPEADARYSYEDAKNLVLEALRPLGETYQTILQSAFTDGWIDVVETQGKTTGAYAWGAYGTHPFILLNYRETLDGTFTLAHELGHAMHSYFSDAHNPYHLAQYVIMVAEVASTVNEVLLLRHMLSKTQDSAMRKYLINHYLDQVRTTVIRQTMFADFERTTHAMVERGEALTCDVLKQTYAALNQKYHGNAMHCDDRIAMEWSRIPHFYNAFYVYKYATGFSSAVAIVEDILKNGQSAVDRYLEFLSSGHRDYPLELLKKVGVDLNTTAPVDACLESFDKMLTLLEELS